MKEILWFWRPFLLAGALIMVCIIGGRRKGEERPSVSTNDYNPLLSGMGNRGIAGSPKLGVFRPVRLPITVADASNQVNDTESVFGPKGGEICPVFGQINVYTDGTNDALAEFAMAEVISGKVTAEVLVFGPDITNRDWIVPDSLIIGKYTNDIAGVVGSGLEDVLKELALQPMRLYMTNCTDTVSFYTRLFDRAGKEVFVGKTTLVGEEVRAGKEVDAELMCVW